MFICTVNRLDGSKEPKFRPITGDGCSSHGHREAINTNFTEIAVFKSIFGHFSLISYFFRNVVNWKKKKATRGSHRLNAGLFSGNGCSCTRDVNSSGNGSVTSRWMICIFLTRLYIWRLCEVLYIAAPQSLALEVYWPQINQTKVSTWIS